MTSDDGHELTDTGSSWSDPQAAAPCEWTVSLLDRRRDALVEVAAALGPACRRPDRPAVALRDYGPGCLCVGIAGPVDRARVALLQTLLGGLRLRGRHDLTITLAGIGPCHPQLSRVLAHIRIQHLVAGAHVELHHLPAAMTALRGAGATTFVVRDARPAGPPAARSHADGGR